MKEKDSQSIYTEYFSPCMQKVTNLLMEKGQGPYLISSAGEKYLDFVQGIAVNALGHAHPSIVEAACEQTKKLIHGSFNLVNYPSTLQLARELPNITPGELDMFFFTNSGAEAVEGSLKLARYISNKPSFIAFRGSFHGRTMGAASVTSSNSNFRKHYAPFVPQVYFAPYPYCFRCPFGQKVESCNLECLDYLRQDFNYIIPRDEVSALLFEPILGEGGYIVPPTKYVRELRDMCDEYGILLIFDEVQSGMGRTGKMFASEHFQVVPDIMVIGKAVGGGFPLGIVASTKENMSRWETGAHGTTFGGHPVAAAAALAQLQILTQEDFLTEVERKGKYLRSQLNELAKRFPEIADVRGLGLMNGVELVKDKKNSDPEKALFIQKYLLEKKVFILTCGPFKNVIRFIPPLNITEPLIDQVMDVFKKALEAS